jgi:hypothetical protein
MMKSSLSSESEQAYASLRAELENELKPKGAIERIFLDDIAAITFDIYFLHRVKAGIRRNAYPAAIESILKQVGFDPDYLRDLGREEKAIQMARAYLHDTETKKMVVEILHLVGLDEGAFEAEAFRLASADLERIDAMLSAAERRRYKALRSIAKYRQSLAIQARQVTDRMIADADASSRTFEVA